MWGEPFRTGRGRRHSLAKVVLLTVSLGSALPARSQSLSEGVADIEAWARGPVRWLLLSAEQRRLKSVESAAEAVRFIETFWALRDPDPATPANPFREEFAKRVEAADLLYVENDVRGGLTDRGRALILLGAPSGLRVTSREALAWDPASPADDNVRVRYLPLEIWTYQLEDFNRPLAQALMAKGDETEFRVSFVKDVTRTSLQEGELLLELAGRTAVALSSEQ